MVDENLANEIIQEGRNYLLSFDEVTEDILVRHLNGYKERYARIENLSDVYRAILESARSQRQMPNVIGNIVALADSLCGFNPNLVVENYGNDYNEDYSNVFNIIAPNEANNAPHNSWVRFSKTVISAANFLSQFDDIRNFNDFTEEFTANPMSRIGLPLLLKEEIFGFGFALACNFIKETISPEYVKPDTHIIYIFKGLEISRQSASDYEIFKDVIEFSTISNQVPYTVDKLFWLIGSGNFYKNDLRINTDRQSFVEQVRNNLQM